LYFMLRLDERKRPESWTKQNYITELRAAITQARHALVIDTFRKRKT
jgi:hypothetical protein